MREAGKIVQFDQEKKGRAWKAIEPPRVTICNSLKLFFKIIMREKFDMSMVNLRHYQFRAAFKSFCLVIDLILFRSGELIGRKLNCRGHFFGICSSQSRKCRKNTESCTDNGTSKVTAEP